MIPTRSNAIAVIKKYEFPENAKEYKFTILWASRHDPLSAQLDYLYRRFGAIRVIQIAKFFNNAEEVLSYALRFDAKIIVAVLPLSIISKLLDLVADTGIRVLYSEMEKIYEGKEKPKSIDEDSEVLIVAKDEEGNTLYKVMRFKKFHYIRAIRMELEPL